MKKFVFAKNKESIRLGDFGGGLVSINSDLNGLFKPDEMFANCEESGNFRLERMIQKIKKDIAWAKDAVKHHESSKINKLIDDSSETYSLAKVEAAKRYLFEYEDLLRMAESAKLFEIEITFKIS